jgi:pimeloyl-ACP methyl ester carboxylesterase
VNEATVVAALAAPGPAREATVEAAGIPFHVLAWGDDAAAPLLLLHGVTASAATWWRVGPAIAATGYCVVAPDLPGHGLTGHWTGHHRFRDSARDLAAFARVALPGVDAAAVRVVGHSWGAMTAAALPAVGFVPERLVMIDPPAIPLGVIGLMLQDPVERHYDDLDEAVRVIGQANPTWSYGDVVAKAEGLTQFEDAAARSVLSDNGDWDGGLADLADPAARNVPVRLIRGDPERGGYIPESALPGFVARLGAEHIATIAGAPHSPHRTHPAETTLAILRALER